MLFFKGAFLSKDEIRVSPDDRGYYFGDGIYEVFRFYNGKLFEMDRHLARLERTANEVRIPLPYERPQIEDIAFRLVHESGYANGIVYLQVTRGEAPRNHQFPMEAEPVMFAYCNEVQRPIESFNEGVSVITAEDIRWLRCDLKTLNLLPNALVKQKAVEQGAKEVILHRGDVVTECSSSNVMIVKDGAIVTHPANNLILNGVTRAVLLELARGAGIEAHEVPFTLKQLAEADEVILVSTISEATPIIRIDGKPVADGRPGAVTRKLQELFAKYVGLA
jgi:D-alanine transaminase